MKRLSLIIILAIIAIALYYCSKPTHRTHLSPIQADSVWCDTTKEVCGITEDFPTPEQQDSLKAIGKENEIYKLLK